MFSSRLHPTPTGLALGVLSIALWAAMWIWFLAQVATVPQNALRQQGPKPELAQTLPRSERPISARRQWSRR
jgi:hypothetical protein